MDIWGNEFGDPDMARDFEDSRDPDKARGFESSQILFQPLGGEGPEPDSAPFSQSGVPCTQGRTKSRFETDIGEIPVESFGIPPSATSVPGLKPLKEKSVGASGRRKAKDPKTHKYSNQAEVSQTVGEIDALGKFYTSAYALDVDELPLRMPKLPFASRLAVDINEGSHFAGDGGYQRWLDHSPLARTAKEGEEGRTGRDKRSRSAPQPRIASRENSRAARNHSREIGADLYPMGFETRLPPFPQAIKIPSTSKHMHLEALKKERLMSSPVVHVADVSEDDDADSWTHEIEDASRTVMCGSSCRLDGLVPLSGLTTSRTKDGEGPVDSSLPSEVTMSGLSEFVGKADDKVLSYILEQSSKSDPKEPQVERTPSRLAPGMPLPGQVPGFPLQL